MEQMQKFVGQQIYNLLKANILDLPDYRYNINDVANSAIVFQSQHPEMKFYFGDIFNFSFLIYNINYQGFLQQAKQLEQNEKIVEALRTQLKELTINGTTYDVFSIYINGEITPHQNWVLATLESVDETSQVYTLNLGIQLTQRHQKVKEVNDD